MSDEPEVGVERRWAAWAARTLGGSERQRDDAAIAAAHVGLMGGTQAEAIGAAQAAWQRSLEEASLAPELGAVTVDATADSDNAAVALTRDEAAAARALFVLRIVGGDEELGSVFPLVEGETTIGRGIGRDIRLDDRSVSHAHAVIAVIDGRVSIWDTGSTNGIRVNDRHIDEPTELSVGDTIALGDAQLVLELDDREAERGFEHGRTLQQEGRHHEALAEFERVVKSEHRFFAGHAAYAAARLCQQLGNEDDAIGHFERAFKAGQGDTAARASFELGKLLARRGELSEAVRAFDEATKLGDDDMRLAAAAERSDVLRRLGPA
jgi:tetratricopeptide (TPR) repeat protein